MTTSTRVLVIGGSPGATTAFDTLPNVSFTSVSTTGFKAEMVSYCDLVAFIGNHNKDIDPLMYGEEQYNKTLPASIDELLELGNIFHLARDRGKPIVGIGGGGQLVAVLNGCKLIQHVVGHRESHAIIGVLPPSGNTKGKVRMQFEVTSLHHQMMYPYLLPNSAYNIVGYAKGVATSYKGTPIEDREKKTFCNEKLLNSLKEKGNSLIEPEVVYFPHTNSLAVQYRPEMMLEESKGRQYFVSSVLAYLFNEKNY